MATRGAGSSEEIAFENAIKALEAQMANIGAHLTIDANTRIAYSREVKKMAGELRQQAARGQITWAHAARQAQETRNLVMEVFRSRSTPVGLSLALNKKRSGILLNDLAEAKAQKIFGTGATFSKLSVSQKNRIYAAIVTSAGKPNEAVNRAMTRLSYAGRGVLLISLSISVYNITVSDNKVSATGKELAVTGAGIGGGIAGGAAAGLACGPASLVCVTLGAFVGGALSAFGVGMMW